MLRDDQKIKSVQTKEWIEIPANPYAVQLLVATSNFEMNFTQIRK